MTRRALKVWVSALSLYAGAALAHHSIGMIEIGMPIWMKATVVSYEPKNPHVMIHVDRARADGQLEPLLIEGPIMIRLERMHLARDFIKPGDVIELCGFPYRKDILAKSAALHAMLLVLPDGRWQPWGPYGKLDNCVRPADTPEQWARFLKAVPMGLEYWCKGLGYARVPSVAPPGFVQAVNRQIGDVCE